MTVMQIMSSPGVPVIAGCKDIKITAKGVEVVTADGKTQAMDADTVLPVMQPKPNMDLYETLKDKVPEVYAVGDCAEPNMIVDAVRTGWRAAKEI